MKWKYRRKLCLHAHCLYTTLVPCLAIEIASMFFVSTLVSADNAEHLMGVYQPNPPWPRLRGHRQTQLVLGNQTPRAPISDPDSDRGYWITIFLRQILSAIFRPSCWGQTPFGTVILNSKSDDNLLVYIVCTCIYAYALVAVCMLLLSCSGKLGPRRFTRPGECGR